MYKIFDMWSEVNKLSPMIYDKWLSPLAIFLSVVAIIPMITIGMYMCVLTNLAYGGIG